MLLLLLIILRFVGMIYCSRRAKTLYRNSITWGIFGFISPLLAIIVIHFMKPLQPFFNVHDHRLPSDIL